MLFRSIVGRNPDPELVAMAPVNVEFLGWVENLEPLYAVSRIALAPLRYGAGVKGKIGESLANGVPVVMTPVGAEGMELHHLENAWIATGAEEFARGVIQIMKDDELWSSLSKNGANHIDSLFGPERFTQLLREIVSGG